MLDVDPASIGSVGTSGGFVTDWQTPDIEVIMHSNHDDQDLIGQVGSMCSVFLSQEDPVVPFLFSIIRPVAPEPNDNVSVPKGHYIYHRIYLTFFQVKIISGDDKEQVGRLLQIERSGNCVVDFRSNDSQKPDVKLFQLHQLCKLGVDTR